jgi:hypothetical protein
MCKISKAILHENNDGTVIILTRDNEIMTVPKNKFYDGEYVITSSTHFSPKDFTQVIDPTWTENRGWVYTEHYVDRNGTGGGGGSAFEESLYKKMTDPKDILIAKKLSLLENQQKFKCSISRIDNELEKVNFALNLIEQSQQEGALNC